MGPLAGGYGVRSSPAAGRHFRQLTTAAATDRVTVPGAGYRMGRPQSDHVTGLELASLALVTHGTSLARADSRSTTCTTPPGMHLPTCTRAVWARSSSAGVRVRRGLPGRGVGFWLLGTRLGDTAHDPANRATELGAWALSPNATMPRHDP